MRIITDKGTVNGFVIPGSVLLGPDLVDAVRRVVEYNWADEEEDFREQEEVNEEFTPSAHIFSCLRLINAVLNAEDDDADEEYLQEG